MNASAPTLAVVGLGKQGIGIAQLALAHGYTFVGAVDVGEKVGKPLAQLIGDQAPDATVLGSLDELLALPTPLDIAVLAAAISAEDLAAQANRLLSAGVNVITLHQDLLTPDPSWTPDLQRAAEAGGASFLSTGVQDTWWIHLPALVASSSSSITRIRVSSTLSLESLSVGLSELIGIGKTPAEFAETAAIMLHAPAVLGAALQDTARRMGAVGGEISKTYEAVTLDVPYVWGEGGRTIPVGSAVGTRELASFETDRGILFEGEFRVMPIPVDAAVDELHIVGEPELRLRYEPFPGEGITNVALLARIPDVLAAAPGVLFAADLPSARHHFPL